MSFLGSKRERDASNWRSNHTISVSPSFMILYPQVTHIRFQCYVDNQPAKKGQVLWTRNGLSLSCIKTDLVFACENTLIITRATVKEVGKYRCVLSDRNSSFYTAAVVGIDIYMHS